MTFFNESVNVWMFILTVMDMFVLIFSSLVLAVVNCRIGPFHLLAGWP